MDSNCFGYIKFNARTWLEKFFYGELSFSCAAKFISDYQCSGDRTRGDRLEAVFAHLNKSDKRISFCLKQMGNDLEIIDDGEKVFLRRRSSCLIPIYCIFGITDSFLEVKEQDDEFVRFRFIFPSDMYEGFSNNKEYASVFVQAKTLENEIENTMKHLNIEHSKKFVDYIDKENEEFYFEPTSERKELFIKSLSYKKQNEYRIILPNTQLENAFDRKNIQLCDISFKDRFIFDRQVGMEFTGKKQSI